MNLKLKRFDLTLTAQIWIHSLENVTFQNAREKPKSLIDKFCLLVRLHSEIFDQKNATLPWYNVQCGVILLNLIWKHQKNNFIVPFEILHKERA